MRSQCDCEYDCVTHDCEHDYVTHDCEYDCVTHDCEYDYVWSQHMFTSAAFNCTGTPAAAVPSAAKPPTVGKKLVTPVAKATSASNPSAAPTPVKVPAQVPAKKAAPTAAEGAPTAEGPAAKSKGKGMTGDAEKAPKAPRAKNAYMFFMADKRDAVKGEHPITLPCLTCSSKSASCTQ